MPIAVRLVELPIDHFRLLGVSPSAETEAILRALQLRLDRYPEEGFTDEALSQRAELLRQSADLLTDAPRRHAYEAALLELDRDHPGESSGLDLPSSKEVAGLMLLLEANAPHEAFQLACQGLQPPQAPALGSGREFDLTLLAALACAAAAAEEQDNRRYEAAAGLLHEGMQLLQRMGKLPERRRQLEHELEALLPYRILDLLSRDLGDQTSHQEGLRLLVSFVSKRGGLEGTEVLPAPGGLDQSEFELFFQQIRKFLTVQEQVDLFIHWQKEGSADAGFLAGLALAAVGFSRRKPERVQEARDQLESLDLPGFDPLPLLGCMDLLLGDVDRAQEQFHNSSDNGLQQWLNLYPEDDLAALCEYCRAWLRRDVLPGYRDVDSDAVDLEAWFADRDVQAYVERLDRSERRTQPSSTGFSAASLEQPLSWSLFEPDGSLPNPLSDFEADEPAGDSPVLRAAEWLKALPSKAIPIRDRLANLPRPQMPEINLRSPSRPVLITSGVLAVLVAAVAGLSLFGLRPRPSSVSEIDQPPALEGPKAVLQDELPLPGDSDLNETSVAAAVVKPLNVDQPSDAELQNLLQVWLASKATVLAGGESQSLAVVARDPLVQRVAQERAIDAAQGETQRIEASISSLEVINRTPQRIELKALVAYRDQKLNADGKVVDETTQMNLPVTYILGRDGDSWRLHAYKSGG